MAIVPPSSTVPAVADRPPLTAAQEARALQLSLLEGMLFATMVGISETYFVANAVQLGASPFMLGLVTALPLLVGTLGPLAALRGLRWVRARRPFVVGAAFLQAVVLLLIASLNGARVMTPAILLGLLCAYQVFGQTTGTLWSSWFGDLVPVERRGSYFSRRTRLVHLATFLGLVAGGVLLHLLEPGPDGDLQVFGRGFQVVFTIAGAARLGSAVMLLASPEPRFRGLPAPTELLRFLRTARGTNSWRLLLGGALFHVGVYASAPFYAQFMLHHLRFPWLEYMAVTGLQVAVKVLTMPWWGRLVDRFGARNAYATAIVLAALVPLPWMFVSGVEGVAIAQALSGFGWGGYEVALFAIMLDASVRKTRPLVFTAQTTCNGCGQIAGSMLGAAVLDAGGFFWVFFASFVGRMAVALVLPRFVHDLRPAGAERREPLLLRVLGFRPNAGINHRPINDPIDEAD